MEPETPQLKQWRNDQRAMVDPREMEIADDLPGLWDEEVQPLQNVPSKRPAVNEEAQKKKRQKKTASNQQPAKDGKLEVEPPMERKKVASAPRTPKKKAEKNDLQAELKGKEKNFAATLKNLHSIERELVKIGVNIKSLKRIGVLLATLDTTFESLQKRKIIVVLTGNQGLQKTELVNRILCGDKYLHDNFARMPLPAGGGGCSKTRFTVKVQSAASFRLVPVLKGKDSSKFPNLLVGQQTTHEEKSVPAIQKIIDNVEAHMGKDDFLLMEGWALEGPFPGLPSNIILVDTPGIGHQEADKQEDNSDNYGRQVLGRELPEADVILYLSHRVADEEMVKLLISHGAFRENSLGKISVFASGYWEEKELGPSPKDQASLETSIQKALSHGNSMEEDVFTRQRILKNMTSNFLLFPRFQMLRERHALNDKLETMRQHVINLELQALFKGASLLLFLLQQALSPKPNQNSKLKTLWSRHIDLTEDWWKYTKYPEVLQSLKEKLYHAIFSFVNLVKFDMNAFNKPIESALHCLVEESLIPAATDYLKNCLLGIAENYDNKIEQPNNEPYRKLMDDSSINQEIYELILQFAVRSWSYSEGMKLWRKALKRGAIMKNLRAAIQTFLALPNTKRQVQAVQDSEGQNPWKALSTSAAEALSQSLTQGPFNELVNLFKEKLAEALDESLYHLQEVSNVRVDPEVAKPILKRVKTEIKSLKVMLKKRVIEGRKETRMIAADPLPRPILPDALLQALKNHETARSNNVLRFTTLHTKPPRDVRIKPVEGIPSDRIQIKVNWKKKLVSICLSPALKLKIEALQGKLRQHVLHQKRLIYPLFTYSWVSSEKDFTTDKSKRRQYPNLEFEQFEGIEHILFIIVEKSQATWYSKFLDDEDAIVVVLPTDGVNAGVGLDIAQMMAAAFDFPFWWRVTPDIASISEFRPEILRMRVCESAARCCLYGQQQMHALYAHICTKIADIVAKSTATFNLLFRTLPSGSNGQDSVTTALNLIQDLVDARDNINSHELPMSLEQLHSLVESLMDAIPKQAGTTPREKALVKIVHGDFPELLVHMCQCSMTTLAQELYLHQNAYSQNGSAFKVFTSRTNVNNIVLNNAWSQKGFYFTTPHEFWSESFWKDNICTSIPDFNEAVRAKERNFVRKIAKSGRKSVQLLNFGRSVFRHPDPDDSSVKPKRKQRKCEEIFDFNDTEI